METKSKNFYFQEIDWLICFPTTGNEGRKYLFYSIVFIDRKKKQMKPQVILSDIVDSQIFEKGYPHTVGFFKDSISNEMFFPTHFLEIRRINCIEEFWKFLNDLDI